MRLEHRIRENCRAAGVLERFDAELTRRWADLIADAIEHNDTETFDEFVTTHPELLRPDLLGLPSWIAESAEDQRELPLTGGWVTGGVVRIGPTVRRPSGPNAPFVHGLLEFLEKQGFDAAPRFLGFDRKGREILSFIEGDVPSDCRAMVWNDDQLEEIARLLRRFHDVTGASELAGEAEVVCHNDFGPWNLVWRGGLPVGIIDFDNAAPGARLDDLGYATWKCLNLGLIDLPLAEQRRRTRLLAAAYGTRPDSALLQTIDRAQTRMRELIISDNSPNREALDQIDGERAWLQKHGGVLIG